MEKLEEIASAMEKRQKRLVYILYPEIRRSPEKDRWTVYLLLPRESARSRMA